MLQTYKKTQKTMIKIGEEGFIRQACVIDHSIRNITVNRRESKLNKNRRGTRVVDFKFIYLFEFDSYPWIVLWYDKISTW